MLPVPKKQQFYEKFNQLFLQKTWLLAIYICLHIF